MHAPLRPDSAYAFLVDVTLSDGSKLHGEGQFHTGLMNASISAWGGAEWLAGNIILKFTLLYYVLYYLPKNILAHTHSQRCATESHWLLVVAGTASLDPDNPRRNNLHAVWELSDAPSSASAFVAGCVAAAI